MPGEKLLIKLWTTLTKEGIGSLMAPWQIKRVGKAHAEVRCAEMIMFAQAEKDAADIREGTKKFLPDGRLVTLNENEIDDFGRVEPTLFLEDTTQRVAQREQSQKIREEININKTIYLAEEELLRSQQEPSEKDVDPEWIFRWREHAKNTNNEQLRDLWAKTLAGEIKSPGSYSFRTLEFIKNLSQDEASAISKLGQFAVGRSIFKGSRLEECGIDFGFLLQMDDLGILHGVQGGTISGLELKFGSQAQGKFFTTIINRNRILLVESDDASRPLSLGCYQISSVGAELLSLGDFSADEAYMRELGTLIKGKGFKVRIALFVQTSRDGGRYFNEEEL